MGARSRVVALVPARSGSKRVQDKNIRPLAGHPTLAYTIVAARLSGIFDRVIVSTDSEQYARIAQHYGADVPFFRPPQLAGDTSPDIEWVAFTLRELQATGHDFDAFSILRPTSPFRSAEMIQRGWAAFSEEAGAHSLRAVEKCKQHPGKMWIVRSNRMLPLLPFEINGTPWHSNQYQALPEVYVQNASLEFAWSENVFTRGTIAGDVVVPFVTTGFEGFDVNYEEDWQRAEQLIAAGKVTLPPVASASFLSESQRASR
jgi:CMP-N,N'-diacetyllegionaminic acid synthase